MTNEERQYRASEARRLLDEPMLRQAFAYLESSTIEDALRVRGAEPEDDRTRRALLERVTVVRDLRGHLEQAIAEGKTVPARY